MDSGTWYQGRSVSPPEDEDADIGPAAFCMLLQDCQPATFGKGAEEVFDEKYRKVGKMDATTFCTSFNLAEHEIIDTVTQALAQVGTDSDNHNGIKAELYMLNVSLSTFMHLYSK
jgi:hypothetical protein